jgi:hypothetical protein
MKKSCKRFLGILLAMLMCFSCTAFAYADSDNSSDAIESVITDVVAAGVHDFNDSAGKVTPYRSTTYINYYSGNMNAGASYSYDFALSNNYQVVTQLTVYSGSCHIKVEIGGQWFGIYTTLFEEDVTSYLSKISNSTLPMEMHVRVTVTALSDNTSFHLKVWGQ